MKKRYKNKPGPWRDPGFGNQHKKQPLAAPILRDHKDR